ncbi:alpha/beta hydrolase [Streptomyces sp. NBC_01207]|uniref:alpha/beta hydrolase n=1 Tax=Streptomyces sp. NBC_01207 TaxID=2903772 RepID=UPI002E152DA4|nr:lysophospholipase [Streptomyces sp. NBC_01207]
MVVRNTVHKIDGEKLSVCQVLPETVAGNAYGVVIMHGAGTGNKAQNLPLARDFSERGHYAFTLDFSGHGDSTGALSELSLQRRRDQAAGVIANIVPEELPLVLIGFSMSGQTVADLVALLGDRVAAVVLCAPGVYGRSVWNLPFGESIFTDLIRRPESWRDSVAVDIYAEFSGRAVLVVPEEDAVIPLGVTEVLARVLTIQADFVRLRLMGASHQLGSWLANNPQDREKIVNSVLLPYPSTRVSENGK